MRVATVPKTETFRCTQCGAQLTVRCPGRTVVVACASCGSVVDAKDPNHHLIGQYQIKVKHQPRIPLGARGQVRGELYECIGFMRRGVVVEGARYEWSEYLLWNPMRGYRWLAEYGGHWTYIKPCSGIPKVRGLEVSYLDRTYRRFQSADAETSYVYGEFTWEVKVGDKAKCTDYVSPPLILSEEKSAGETTWSIGEYIDAKELWAAFKLPGEPPAPSGVAPAQPSPYEALKKPMLRMFLVFLGVAFAVQFMGCLFAANRVVHSERFTYAAADKEKSRVTGVFELTGRTCNVQIDTTAAVDQNWAYFDIALVNQETGDVWDLGREVEHYHGVEDGEAWSEGTRSDACILGMIPAGKYFLRIEPETPMAQLQYSVSVTRDVPRFSYFFWVVVLLAAPFLWFWYRQRSFEYQRWLESDYPMRPLLKTSSDEE